MAYFDNAATTFPKPNEVYDFMDEFYRNHGGNAGRGNYSIAKSANTTINETRSLLQELLHCPAKQVIFTPTATIALNMIIQGIINKGAKNIYISPFEHNAVTRTLHHFKELGLVNVEELEVSKGLEFDLERIRYQFDQIKPDLVIISHASNVIGLVAPVEEIFTLAKKYSATTIVDMSQTAGVIDLNVGLETIDFAVFAGHKTLLGPTGIAGFVMDPKVELPPVFFGGTGFDSANQNMPDSLPEKYEMGTLNIVGIAGLNAALKWLKSNGIENIYDKENENREKLLSLLNEYDFINIIGNVKENKYVGIVSCLFDGISSDEAGGVLADRGISVRTGLHCSPLAHKFLETYPAGTIRFSVSALTTDKDFQELEEALDDLEEYL